MTEIELRFSKENGAEKQKKVLEVLKAAGFDPHVDYEYRDAAGAEVPSNVGIVVTEPTDVKTQIQNAIRAEGIKGVGEFLTAAAKGELGEAAERFMDPRGKAKSNPDT